MPARPANLRRVDITLLVAGLAGQPPLSVASTSSPLAWRVELPGVRAIAKLPTPDQPGTALTEAWAYARCAELGVPAPEVIATSADPECILVTALPGRSLWEVAAAHAWPTAGADLRRLHEIQLEGYGPLRWNGGKPCGTTDSWSPWVTFAYEDGLTQLAAAGCISASETAEWEERIRAALPTIRGRTDARLLHGDLEGGHIFVTSDGVYAGIIDWGLAQAGDPLWDIARVALWDGPAARAALIDGYGGISAADRELLPIYLTAFVVHQAVRRLQEGRHDAARAHLSQIDLGVDGH